MPRKFYYLSALLFAATLAVSGSGFATEELPDPPVLKMVMNNDFDYAVATGIRQLVEKHATQKYYVKPYRVWLAVRKGEHYLIIGRDKAKAYELLELQAARSPITIHSVQLELDRPNGAVLTVRYARKGDATVRTAEFIIVG